ncbi:hypothetical protein D3C72_1012920 [compost metagenome]
MGNAQALGADILHRRRQLASGALQCPRHATACARREREAGIRIARGRYRECVARGDCRVHAVAQAQAHAGLSRCLCHKARLGQLAIDLRCGALELRSLLLRICVGNALHAYVGSRQRERELLAVCIFHAQRSKRCALPHRYQYRAAWNALDHWRLVGRQCIQVQAQHDRVVVAGAVGRCSVEGLGLAVLGVVVEHGGLFGIDGPLHRLAHLGDQGRAHEDMVERAPQPVKGVRIAVRHLGEAV